VCNNSPAESTSPENGWRSSVLPILVRCRRINEALERGRLVAASKGVATISVEVSPRGLMELSSVQILVVVANIQVRTLKTEVEKGSM
jgi:hypothetical protein